MEHNIRLEILLPHSREHVWQALTEADVLGAWFMPNDFKPELHYAFTFHMKPQRGWDGLTHCEVIALDPLHRLAYTYRGKASGEKTLACAGINSQQANRAVKGIFTELDTVLQFTLLPEYGNDGTEQTRLVLEHTGFRGPKLMLVSLVMGWGWRKMLRRLSVVLAQCSPAMTIQPLPGGETFQARS
jgi:uncharacterized protein YndB with AHSA1/START domain